MHCEATTGAEGFSIQSFCRRRSNHHRLVMSHSFYGYLKHVNTMCRTALQAHAHDHVNSGGVHVCHQPSKDLLQCKPHLYQRYELWEMQKCGVSERDCCRTSKHAAAGGRPFSGGFLDFAGDHVHTAAAGVLLGDV